MFNISSHNNNVSIFGDLSIPYVSHGIDMSNYKGNICINASNGYIGTKKHDNTWYWR
jgi:hypothetical protein